MDAPKDANLHLYLKECKKNNVTQIVRISEPSYSKDEVEKSGIGLNVSISHLSLSLPLSLRASSTSLSNLELPPWSPTRIKRKCSMRMGRAPRLKSSRDGWI